jgi:phenylacetate-CoA ligase
VSKYIKLRKEKALSGKIREEIKNQIMVSANIHLVDYGSFPRSQRKAKRLFDNRDQWILDL